MKNLNSAKILIVLSGIGMFYNLLILVGIIPYEYAWGGRLDSYEQVLQFEIMGLIVNTLIILIVAMKAGYVRQVLPQKLMIIVLWGLAMMFALNTVGNLFASTAFEKILFTPMTLLSTYLFFRLAANKS